MCGRYYVDQEEDQLEIRQILTEINQRYAQRTELAKMKTGEIFPTDYAPVLLKGGSAGIMSWGFPGFGQTRQSIINARAETAGEKPLFRTCVENGRLLVPASAYFEWQKLPDGKQKMKISMTNSRIIYMAGLYRSFVNSRGDRLIAFVIVTRPAADSISGIHDRMPLLLREDDADAWLGSSILARQLLLAPPEYSLTVNQTD